MENMQGKNINKNPPNDLIYYEQILQYFLLHTYKGVKDHNNMF